MRTRGDILKELIEACINEGIKGTHSPIEVNGIKYYATFDFRKQYKKCEKCGQVIKE